MIAILVSGIQSIALANDTVCAGTSVYYRYLQADSGIMRMPATVSVFATLEDGKTLNYTQNADARPEFKVEIKDKKTLFNANPNAAVYEVYSAQLSVNDSSGNVVVSDSVTCTHTQRFLP